MAKGKGQKCPHCGQQKFRDYKSHRKCTSCNYIGWSWTDGLAGVGKGRGNKCPYCRCLTLHDIVKLQHGEVVRRCTTCNYTGIEP